MKHKQKCPTCKKFVIPSIGDKWRPFCSERCRLIDLGEWLDGNKRITTGFNPENYSSEDDNLIH